MFPIGVAVFGSDVVQTMSIQVVHHPRELVVMAWIGAQASKVYAVDLDDVAEPLRDVVDTPDHSAVIVDVSPYAEVGYRGSAT